MLKHFLLIYCVGLSNLLFSQVVNNKIGNRLTLKLDAAGFHSTTARSSVEWDCISKALTNKCLIYHNDQWFDFTPKESGTYYLNISGQECRDKQGIQLVVIEGNPCETRTYKVLKCLSRLSRGDVFVSLDSLKGGVPYLINIDGFLGDYCAFQIQFATRPSGLPLTQETPKVTLAPITLKNRYVTLRWHVSADNAETFDRFHVYRSSAVSPSRLINMQSVRRNAYGVSLQDYEVEDSLQEFGVYVYQVYGIEKESLHPKPLLERQVNYLRPTQKLDGQYKIKLNLNYPEETGFEVMVYDRSTDRLLSSSKYLFDSSQHKLFEIDFEDFTKTGIKEFLVLVRDDQANSKDFYYKVDARTGKMIKE